MAGDLDIIKLWCEKVKIDLPWTKFLLHNVGRIPLEEVEEIINKIDINKLVEIYKEME